MAAVPPIVTYPLRAVRGQSPVPLIAEIDFELRTTLGTWKRSRFRIDSGASISSMNLRLAGPQTTANPSGLDLQLPEPQTARTITKTYADGRKAEVSVLSGVLTARFPALPSFVFHWDCLFDETAPMTPLLGLGGRVLNAIHICFEGRSPKFPDGSIAFDIRTRPVPLFPLSDPLVWETHYAPAGWPRLDQPTPES
jgi:hypothetical protein